MDHRFVDGFDGWEANLAFHLPFFRVSISGADELNPKDWNFSDLIRKKRSTFEFRRRNPSSVNWRQIGV